ncbi:glyoxalase [Nocardia colli]|uniref:Glyoxalase n=1 Tax=Nocardia colli TaxID=2545717 RepID=A0A5N0ENH2_9NOCA|nr:glyoxalase [Nocardia colli]KAA8890662.1 glyoxalase [Nocardia colli]
MANISIPQLWGGDLPATLDFYRTLGYTVTREMTRPYTYGEVQRDGFELHFGPTPKDLSAEQAYISCLVKVDELAAWHAEFSTALRARYGRVPARGLPRITRFRPGQTRFTVVDPVGNSVIYLQHTIPKLKYGGAQDLSGLPRALDNARNYREFKNDDPTATRILETALRRHAPTATPADQARALAILAEIAAAAGNSNRATELITEINTLNLTPADRAEIATELQTVTDLQHWLHS